MGTSGVEVQGVLEVSPRTQHDETFEVERQEKGAECVLNVLEGEVGRDLSREGRQLLRNHHFEGGEG